MLSITTGTPEQRLGQSLGTSETAQLTAAPRLRYLLLAQMGRAHFETLHRIQITTMQWIGAESRSSAVAYALLN
jgi:hypothetical protein